jgi:hypothetical protein
MSIAPDLEIRGQQILCKNFWKTLLSSSFFGKRANREAPTFLDLCPRAFRGSGEATTIPKGCYVWNCHMLRGPACSSYYWKLTKNPSFVFFFSLFFSLLCFKLFNVWKLISFGVPNEGLKNLKIQANYFVLPLKLSSEIVSSIL